MLTGSLMKTKRWLRTTVGNNHGQSLVVALMVLFLLAFIVGLFVALISGNVRSTGATAQSTTADYLSDAGLRYADDQLTYGMDGADWRPLPTYPAVVQKLSDGYKPDELPGLLTTAELPMATDAAGVSHKDPDYYWLIRGFSRFMYGRGRFLLRVSYDPTQTDPLSKYIKIESVGRVGTVVFDKSDPTTWKDTDSAPLGNMKVSYKAIGINEYARFITNKDRRSDDIPLGTPRFTTSFGGQQSDGSIIGSPIRVNGNLGWHGKNLVWLERNRGDAVLVSGDIRHVWAPTDETSPAEGSTIVEVNSDLVSSPAVHYYAVESAAVDSTGNTAFDTSPDNHTVGVGIYRDGRSGVDKNKYPREITRLDPPLLDVAGVSGGLSRYRELTRNSGEWKWNATNSEWYNTGFYGWGDGLYLDNGEDLQKESGSYTLRGNWTNPGGPYWTGAYYAPPGVTIRLTPYDLRPDHEPLPASGTVDPETGLPEDYQPCMILTHDNTAGGSKFNWRDADGNILNPAGERLVLPYPKNGVVFAEGNVRIEGTLGPGRKLTVVSAGTIYIEGSILKSPFYYEPTVGNETQLTLKSFDHKNDASGLYEEVQQDSAVALLATDYICVNTPQFFGPLREVLMSGSGGYYFEVTPNQSFWLDFSFGIDPTFYTQDDGTSQSPLELYVCHTSAQDLGAAYMNMLINYPAMAPLYSFDVSEMNAAWLAIHDADGLHRIYPLGDSGAYTGLVPDRSLYQKDPNWEMKAFPLWTDPATATPYEFNVSPGVYNTIGFQLDQSKTMGTGVVDYLLSRAVVQPSDIRIEALLYAENGSFFVIPGEWFNPDTNDTYQNYVDNGNVRPAHVASAQYPFHGQPVDVAITVYGAVSENLPAPIGDSSAWMEKWGWIPPRHGNSSSAGHLASAYRAYLDPEANDPSNPSAASEARRGLSFVYDAQLWEPRRDGAVNPRTSLKPAMRQDSYGRTLPALPKMPVCQQTLYSGEPT